MLWDINAMVCNSKYCALKFTWYDILWSMLYVDIHVCLTLLDSIKYKKSRLKIAIVSFQSICQNVHVPEVLSALIFFSVKIVYAYGMRYRAFHERGQNRFNCTAEWWFEHSKNGCKSSSWLDMSDFRFRIF